MAQRTLLHSGTVINVKREDQQKRAEQLQTSLVRQKEKLFCNVNLRTITKVYLTINQRNCRDQGRERNSDFMSLFYVFDLDKFSSMMYCEVLTRLVKRV